MFTIFAPKSRSTISHINYWDKLNSWSKFWKFWNYSLCRNKSAPFPLLNVVVCWQSSNTKACAKKLSQILANNIDNGGRGIGLRIYVRYCLKNWKKNKKGFGKKLAFFFILNSLFLMFGMCQMVLWLIGLLLDHFDTQKNWSVEIMGRYNGFFLLQVKILSIQPVLFSQNAILLEHQ